MAETRMYQGRAVRLIGDWFMAEDHGRLDPSSVLQRIQYIRDGQQEIVSAQELQAIREPEEIQETLGPPSPRSGWMR